MIEPPELDSHLKFLLKAERDRSILFDNVVSDPTNENAIKKCAQKLQFDSERVSNLSDLGPFTMLDVCMGYVHEIPVAEIAEDGTNVLEKLLRAQIAYERVKQQLFENGDYFNKAA